MNPNNLHDLVIRNGKIFDGSGGKPFIGDVAINDGKISLVGVIEGSGRKEIDAKGNLVTPGWVDIHTHYDGQVCWDPYLTPSSWHGVTTVVMGNCGVGFAPVKPGDGAIGDACLPSTVASGWCPSRLNTSASQRDIS